MTTQDSQNIIFQTSEFHEPFDFELIFAGNFKEGLEKGPFELNQSLITTENFKNVFYF